MIRMNPTLVLALVVVPAMAQGPRLEDSALKFVQGFYHWYIPIAVKDNKGPAFEIAINQKPAYFSPQLLEALQEDAKAQAKAVGEIVGLDFDPFMNSQEPSNHFVLGEVLGKEDGYWVYLYNSKASQKNGKPNMIAVVNQSDGHWFFSNFRFPNGGDLLKTLNALKIERQLPPK